MTDVVTRVLFVDLDNLDGSEVFKLIEDKIAKGDSTKLVGIHNEQYTKSKYLVDQHFDLVHAVPTMSQASDLCIMLAIGYAIKAYGKNIEYTIVTGDKFGDTAVKLVDEAFGIKMAWKHANNTTKVRINKNVKSGRRQTLSSDTSTKRYDKRGSSNSFTKTNSCGKDKSIYTGSCKHRSN